MPSKIHIRRVVERNGQRVAMCGVVCADERKSMVTDNRMMRDALKGRLDVCIRCFGKSSERGKNAAAKRQLLKNPKD